MKLRDELIVGLYVIGVLAAWAMLFVAGGWLK